MSETCCSRHEGKCREEHSGNGFWLLVTGDGPSRRVLAKVWRDSGGGHVQVFPPVPLRHHSECLVDLLVRADVMRPYGL